METEVERIANLIIKDVASYGIEDDLDVYFQVLREKVEEFMNDKEFSDWLDNQPMDIQNAPEGMVQVELFEKYKKGMKK